jgi:polyketide synthase 7
MSARRGIVFVFSGHGCQWTEMARELLDASPLFASHIQACEQALAPHIRWSLSDVLRGKPRARRLQRVDVVQPALFAVTVSLAELWRACGVLPDAVVGHSQGEVAAAHFAGGLSLQDAAMIVARRSRVLAGLSGRGGMAVVASTRDWVEDRIESLGQQLDMGAVNGPRSLAVGGASQPLEELLARCRGEGVTAGKVAIDYASHSRQIEPLREQLLQDLAGVRPRSGELPLFSTVTGGRLDCSVCDAEHW